MKPAKASPIEFRRKTIYSRLLTRDGSGAFVEGQIPVEFRWDPLTRRPCRLVRYSTERITAIDLAALEKRSRELPCPFCPPLVNEIIPRFPPDIVPRGVIRRGKALAFPNTGPYDILGAVIVMTDKHFIPPAGFTIDILLDALLAAQACIQNATRADPAARHHFIGWNYLPPSGGSLVHPHLQVNAGYLPTFFQGQLLEASRKYYRKTGGNYWRDLLEREKELGERYIGQTGSAQWLTGFAPGGRLSDIIALFPGRTSLLELSRSDLRDFAAGILKVLAYLDGMKLGSLNMSTYSGFDAGQFWAQACIRPRGSLLYSPIETSDQFYYPIMHDESVCILPPEAVCAGLKKHFAP